MNEKLRLILICLMLVSLNSLF